MDNKKAKQRRPGGLPAGSQNLPPPLTNTHERPPLDLRQWGGRGGKSPGVLIAGEQLRLSLGEPGAGLWGGDPGLYLWPRSPQPVTGCPSLDLGTLPSPMHVLGKGFDELNAATAVVSALFTQTDARGPGPGIPRPSHVS